MSSLAPPAAASPRGPLASRFVSGAAAALTVATLLVPRSARAVPGPESVAVVANANVPGSVAIAEAYARGRAIPERQICRLALPVQIDLTLAEYRAMFEAPLAECLTRAGVLDRIEAVVLTRGVPLRVIVPGDGVDEPISLAAALSVWRSEFEGAPLLGQPPGRVADCGGTPCRAARWSNPVERRRVFSAGFDETLFGVRWRPLLVTMLHGRSDADAMRLVTSALEGDRAGRAGGGRFLFMNGADPARGSLDREYDAVLRRLGAVGVSDAARVPFDAGLEGLTLAAFVTGTAAIGRTIEGNRFVPGAIVDNLTSYGAVPVNFEPMGETQVSIARWVAKGVAGVHGTVEEPLSNCFPSRYFVSDYAEGSTLGEAYSRRLPFTYWKNLVLGDPITAPYATRPVVTIEGLEAGDTIAGARRVTVRATDPDGRALGAIALFVAGVEVARGTGATLEACVTLGADTDAQVLAVAQIAWDEAAPDDAAYFQPKGWTERRVSGAAGPTTCADPPDAGVPADAGAGDDDAGTSDAGPVAPAPTRDAGCGCAVPGAYGTTSRGALAVLALVLVAAMRRRALRR
jgi:MYXO-CTERM domain-containing protein